jgi:hypothetical protein
VLGMMRVREQTVCHWVTDVSGVGAIREVVWVMV